MYNVEIRASIHSFTHVLSTKVSWGTKVQVKPNDNTMYSRIRDLARMNPPTLFGSTVEKGPQGFIDEVLKVLVQIGN